MVKRVKPKPLFVIFFLFIFICIVLGCTWAYLESPVDRKDNNEIVVTIESGTNSTQIANILKDKGLIKSTMLFKVHLKIDNVGSLKASTYKFKKSMSLTEIIKILEQGVISNEGAIRITFKDGERITDYAEDISKAINVDNDTVIKKFKDKEYAKTLIGDYWFLTDKVLQDGIYYPLEGYLAPETYYFDADCTVEDIIKRLLDQREKDLEKYKESMKSDPHYYLTMASVVQLEGTNTENRKMIVGIFKNRLSSGMNMGSDVTTYYALQRSMKEDLSTDDFNVSNPYNTRGGNMIAKMPIGPICNPNMSSIEASVNPTANDYLFFVADKHGNIFYTKSNKEHDQKVAEIKAKGDWIFG